MALNHKMMPNKEKIEYVLEIRASSDNNLLHKKEYTQAFSEAQAETYFKIRAKKEGWDYFWGRDYVRILIFPVPKTQPKKTEKSDPKSWQWTSCPKCNTELEDDYCQNCGWRRYAQWYSRIKKEALSIEGKKLNNKE